MTDLERNTRLKAFEDVIKAIGESEIETPGFDSVIKRMDYRQGALERETSICNAIYDLISNESKE